MSALEWVFTLSDAGLFVIGEELHALYLSSQMQGKPLEPATVALR
jgi:hypothetical protein